MVEINLQKLYPHGVPNYREIAFMVRTIHLLDHQYQIPEEGIVSTIRSIGWGLTPVTLLDEFLSETRLFLETWDDWDWVNPLPDDSHYPFCSCNTIDEELLENYRTAYFSGIKDAVQLFGDWLESIDKARQDIVGTDLENLRVHSYGQPIFSDSTELVRFERALWNQTEKLWHAIVARHQNFLASCQMVAEYDGATGQGLLYNLGGCFFLYENGDGGLTVLDPSQDALRFFSDVDFDCIIMPGDTRCQLNHECESDALEDVRPSLRLHSQKL